MAVRAGQAFIAISPSFRGFKTEMTAYVKAMKPIAVPVEMDADKAVIKPRTKAVRVPVEVDRRRFDRAIGALESRLERLSRGRFLINVGVAMSPIAAPTAAVGAGAAGATGGIGAAVFGGGGAFAAVAAQQKETVDEVLKQVEQLKAAGKDSEAAALMESLSAGQVKLADSMTDLKTRWVAFLSTGSGASVLAPFTMLVDGLNKSLPFLGAFLKPVAAGFSQIFKETGKEASQGNLKSIAADLGKFSKGILIDAGRGTRNLARAFYNLLTAFMPLSNDMSGGLVKLTDRFADWTAGLERSKGFQKFVSYVRTNGPVLLSTIGAIALAFVEVGIAISPMAAQMLAGLSTFAKWLAGFAQAHPTIVQFGIGILVASKALAALAIFFAPVLGLLRLLGSGIGLIVRLVPILTTVLRVLFSVLLKNPIGLILTAIVALGAGLVLAYQKSDRFRAIVDAAWAGVRTAVSFAWNKVIKPVFGALRTGLGKVGDVFGSVVGGIKKTWGALSGIVRGPIDKAIDIINGFIGLINKIPGIEIPLIGGNARKYRETLGGDRGMAARAPVRRAFGGSVFGPGTGTSDSIPALLSNNEHVWTAKEVARAGGHGMVERLRSMALHGALPRFASGGRVLPGSGNQHPKAQYPWATYAGDFPVPVGTPVRAWKDGVVASVRSLLGSYGKNMRFNNTDGTSWLIAHMSRFAASVGDRVKQGQVVGYSGNSGNSTGPHGHLEFMGGPYKGGSGGGSIWDTLTGATGKIGGWIKSKLLDKANIGGLFGNVSGLFSTIGTGVKNFVTDKLFDSGGLALGTGYMAKNTISPERVLSPRQTVAFERLAPMLARQYAKPSGGLTAAQAQQFQRAFGGDRPIYTDAGVLLGMIREVSGEEARLVWADEAGLDGQLERAGVR